MGYKNPTYDLYRSYIVSILAYINSHSETRLESRSPNHVRKIHRKKIFSTHSELVDSIVDLS